MNRKTDKRLCRAVLLVMQWAREAEKEDAAGSVVDGSLPTATADLRPAAFSIPQAATPSDCPAAAVTQ